MSFVLIFTGLAVPVQAEEDRSGAITSSKNRILPPLITEQYIYHEVCGCSEKDLHCDLTQKAIKCNDGNKYDSVTKWKIKWDYGYDRSSGTCSIDSFKVFVDITTHLPKWTSMDESPQPLVDKWNSYIKNLNFHEKGHRDRVVDAATEMTLLASDLPPTRFCSDLDRKLDSLSGDRLKRLLEDQAEYDAVTGHGHSQGVAFP